MNVHEIEDCEHLRKRRRIFLADLQSVLTLIGHSDVLSKLQSPMTSENLDPVVGADEVNSSVHIVNGLLALEDSGDTHLKFTHDSTTLNFSLAHNLCIPPPAEASVEDPTKTATRKYLEDNLNIVKNLEMEFLRPMVKRRSRDLAIEHQLLESLKASGILPLGDFTLKVD